MYGKIINGVFHRGRYQMTEKEALANGYKPVVLTPAPVTDDNHMPVEAELEETEKEIIRHWDVVEIDLEGDLIPEDSEDKESKYAEAYKILMGVKE